MVAAVLDRPTLVLNRNWQPVGVATVARALVKVFSENARVVDPENYQTYAWDDWAELSPTDDELAIRTSQLLLRVPEVISLMHYDRVPVNAVTFSRRNVFKRDRFTCQYCGCQPGNGELTIDHVVPRARGGTSSWTNCVLACVDCNTRKADRSPQQVGMLLRQQPIRPKWRPLYATHGQRIDSWSKFVSEAYWNVELEE
jgi:5-methylcytosine-specific restriction endonuclease McrA